MGQITGKKTHVDKSNLHEYDRTITGSELWQNYKQALDVQLANVGVLTTKIAVDSVVTTTTYIGKSPPGTADGTAQWQIKRISVSGGVTAIQWADSDIEFNNSWSNREALSYG